MTALAGNRNTPELAIIAGGFVEREIDVAASVKLYAGALVCVTAAGYATPGATATTLIAMGRCEELADNSAGVAGAIKARVKPGVFKFANSSAADQIAADDIGKDAYVVDDQTVALTDGTSTRSKAGKIVGVDTDGGVFVAVGLAAIFA